MENLEIILTQTGHNIERIFADKKLNKQTAYTVLKTRNELALKAVKNLNKPCVIKSVCPSCGGQTWMMNEKGEHACNTCECMWQTVL